MVTSDHGELLARIDGDRVRASGGPGRAEGGDDGEKRMRMRVVNDRSFLGAPDPSAHVSNDPDVRQALEASMTSVGPLPARG